LNIGRLSAGYAQVKITNGDVETVRHFAKIDAVSVAQLLIVRLLNQQRAPVHFCNIKLKIGAIIFNPHFWDNKCCILRRVPIPAPPGKIGDGRIISPSSADPDPSPNIKSSSSSLIFNSAGTFLWFFLLWLLL
jgi:hypothetical protein